MKIKLLIIFTSLIFVFSESVVFAQPTFSKTYLYSTRILQLLQSSPDGGYFFAGRNSNFDIIIGKVDSVGNLQWAKECGGIINETAQDLVVLDNGNVVVCFQVDSGAFSSTTQAWFISFDSNGNLVFSKRYNSALPGAIRPVNMTADGNYFWASILGEPQGMKIIRLDSLGNTYTGFFVDYGTPKLLLTNNGGYLFYSFGGAEILLDASLQLIKAQVSILQLSPVYQGCIQLPSGSFIYYGGENPGNRPFLCKKNANLQFEWARDYSFATNGYFAGRLVSGYATSDNSLIFFSVNSDCSTFSDCRPLVLQTDTMGNILSFKRLNVFSNVVFASTTKGSYNTGKFSFINNLYNFGNFNGLFDRFNISTVDTTLGTLCNLYDTTLISTNWNLQLTSTFSPSLTFVNDTLLTDSITITDVTFPFGGCSDTTLNVKDDIFENKVFNIYPNPFNNQITIQCSYASHPIRSIEVKDYLGRSKYLEHFKDENEIQISAPWLESGIYFMIIGTGKSSYSQKIVKY